MSRYDERKNSKFSPDSGIIKTVFFDLGNVLVFFSHPKMVEQLASCTGLSSEQIQNLLVDQKFRELYETGAVDSSELYQMFRAVSPKPFTPPEFYYAASDIFTPNNPIYPLVHSLKEHGLRLILLSNTSPAHFAFIEARYPVLDHFDAKILSYEVGACKPDPLIYRAALETALCSPQECFYTDDIPEYIEGAKIHGIDAEPFIDVPTLKAHLSKRGIPENAFH